MLSADTLAVVLSTTMNFASQKPSSVPAAPPSISQPAPQKDVEAPVSSSVHVAILKRFPVLYPESADTQGVQGEVVLSVLFDESGQMQEAEVTSGSPILAAAALDSVKKWTIDPFTEDGQPVKVRIPLTFTFLYGDPVFPFIAGSEPASESAVDHVSLAGLSAAMLEHKVLPAYPQEARSAHLGGAVVFAAVIGKDGAVRELQTLSSPAPELATAARQAVRLWRYKPYVYQGHRVEFDLRIQVNFAPAP